MTQLGMGVAAQNHESKFQEAYERGIKKSEYWTYALEDSMDLLARLPALAARIYRNIYNPGTPLPKVNKDLDLVGQWSRSLRIDATGALTMFDRQLREYAWLRRQPRPHGVPAPLHLDPR